MYVTLNISNRSLRILSVKGRRVNKWGSAALSAGMVRDGLILQPEAVGEAIDALFKSTKVPKEKVITSLSGLAFTYRFLNLPRMKPAFLEEAIRRAAKKEISLPLDELYLSWQPVPGQEDEPTFFVLGVSRHLIDTMIRTLMVAGVEPYLMDLQPLALARAANRGDAIVANLEPECYDIVIIANGLPAVIHTISPRGEGATLEDNIQRLADELIKTVAFYQSHHPENHLSPATPLLLSGELAAEVTTHGLLQTEIEYPVEPLIPTLEFPADLPVASYATSMGLAMKKIPQKPADNKEAVRFYDININILSGKYRKPRARPLPVGYILLSTFLVIAVACLYPLYQGKSRLDAENMELESRLHETTRELNLATLIAEEVITTEATIQEITANTENMTEIQQGILGTRGDFTNNLQVTKDALPIQLYLKSLEIDKELITVQGETDSLFTVVSYATALEAQEMFSEVRITKLGEDIITSVTDEGEVIETENTVITFEILISKSVLADFK
jgi:Tfp pilus assembly PilM family ATPase